MGQAKKPIVRIAWLTLFSREARGRHFAVFREELARLGWVDGLHIVIEERWADGRRDRLPVFARDLVESKPALIVASPAAAAAMAANAAPQTPVVALGVDLVAIGLAKSFARPGGMITGISTLRADLAEKYLELLLATVPSLERIGFLADPNSPVHAQSMDAARRSTERYSVKVDIAEAGKPEEIEPAVSRLAKSGAQALILLPSAFFTVERRRIVSLALANRWPAISGEIEWAEAGALITYGVVSAAMYRRLAYFVDRILRGAKPGNLPIEQPTKFAVTVNMKTAKALGLTIPQSFLVRADRVIE
jgi:putative ABC transport system substrate-binding protein